MAKMSGANSSVLATPARNADIGVVSDDFVISSRVMDVECSWCAELARARLHMLQVCVLFASGTIVSSTSYISFRCRTGMDRYDRPCWLGQRTIVLLDTVSIRRCKPTEGHNLINWCGRGTVIPETQGDLHILFVTGDRDINRIPPERLTHRINDLDALQIDQGRYRESVDRPICVSMLLQRPRQNADAFGAATGMPLGNFFEPFDCRGDWECWVRSIEQESCNMRNRGAPNHAEHLRKFF